MQALVKLTNNVIRNIDFSEGIKIEVSGESKTDSSLTVYHCVNLVFYYKENKYPVFSSMVSENDKDFDKKLIMLEDLLSFVAKEAINMIFKIVQDGKASINLVAIVDNIIKSTMSPVDAPIVESAFVLYNNAQKEMLDDYNSWENVNIPVQLIKSPLPEATKIKETPTDKQQDNVEQ